MNTLTIDKKDGKEIIEAVSLKELFEKALMYSLKYDCDIVNNHTGEVHFSSYQGKIYMSSDMKLVVLRFLD